MHLIKAFSLSTFLTLVPNILWAAADFKIWSQPLTETSYEKIDLASVYAQAVPLDADWVDRIRQANSMLAGNLSATAIATIDITFLDGGDSEDSLSALNSLMEAGRKRASDLGANVFYISRCLMENGQASALHLIAYRVLYNDLLVPPPLLADLPQREISEDVFARQVQVWNDRHFGKVRVSFKTEGNPVAPGNVVDFFGKIRNGTPVRVVLQNGQDYRGAYEGMDDDDQIWIRPEGWTGLIAERSFHVKNVEGAGLLN